MAMFYLGFYVEYCALHDINSAIKHSNLNRSLFVKFQTIKMKVILLVLLVFESTKKSVGLKQDVIEHDFYQSNTVFLDGVGVGSSANEHTSHILFANTEERISPITTDTLPSTEKTSLTTTGKITPPTTGKITLPTTEDTTTTTKEKTSLPTTEDTTTPTKDKTSLPTTEDTTTTTKRNISLPTTEDTTTTTKEKTSLPTTEDTTMTTKEKTTFSTTESTAISTTPVVNTTPFSVVFKDCGSRGSRIQSGQINSVKIQCAGSFYRRLCFLKRNTTARVFVNFTSNVDTTKVKTIVHGILPYPQVFLHLLTNDGEEGVRFNGVTEDACVNNVDHCNIKAGEAIQYANAVIVYSFYPLIRLTIKLEIRDDQDRNLACIVFPAEIAN